MARLLSTLAIGLIALPLWLNARKPIAVADDQPKSADTKPKENDETAKPKFELVSLRGRVDYLPAVLERRYGIKSVPEAAERQLVLEDPAGELYPLVEDVRGRAFRVDRALREFDVELLVRRYQGSPAIQIIQVFAIKPDGKYELDYWCDVCAIAMYELKVCDCCQAPNYLRQRLVEKKSGNEKK